jgi:4-amino-4-deoxy-L-arabinose transferase-like glycosyltransferase
VIRHPRSVFWLLWLGLAVRAAFWIVGGNLPLVPGDSSHYIEVARSVYRGEGPVKHYVESYFLDYSRHGILDGRGVLDDWATPLWAYVLAAAYRLTGVVPGASMDATFAVAKGSSLLFNWLTLPVLYGFTRRWLGPRVAILTLGILAILPVHALYAGMALRESLVGLTSLVALGALVEVWRARGRGAWAWSILAGLAGGLAILARNTGLALIGIAWLYAALGPGRRRLGPLLLSGALTAAVLAPWAWATYREYGEPFFTYTKFYPYNFSWTVHHYDRGNTRPDQFYRPENLPGIAEAKLKSLAIVPAYTSMILGLPLAAAFALRLARPRPPREGEAPAEPPLFGVGVSPAPLPEPPVPSIPPTPDLDRLALVAFLAFLLATLVQIADVTQVRQLGRYYLPVYLLMLPTAAAGLLAWTERNVRRRAHPALAFTLVALLWAGPGWAYDFTWYGKPFHARWPALAAAGAWIRENPESVPPDARILTWFPWELRVTSDRTTILFPRALEGGAYEVARLRDAIARYRPTHVLWGSFEPTPEADPEALGRYLESLRAELGLVDSDLLHTSPPGTPHPVRLYRLRGATR